MNLLKKLFKRPVTVCVIIMLCMGLGAFAATQMKTALLPDIAFPALGVTVAYPGASASTCDGQIRPIMEDAVKTVSGIKSISSHSVENASTLALTFDYGTDVDDKIDELKDKLALVAFPDGCMEPVYSKVNFNGLAVSTVSVYSETSPERAFADAELLKDKLLSIEGVGSVTTVGGEEESISITPINGLEMTTLLIVQALGANSQLNIPLGSLTEDGATVSYRNETTLETIEDIENTPFQLPVTSELAEAMSSAKEVMVYVQDTPSADIKKTRDQLKATYDAVMNVDVKSGEELLAELEKAIDFAAINTALNDLGMTELAGAIDGLHTYLKENPDTLDLLNREITSAQDKLREEFGDGFFEKLDILIEFKSEHEYTNPITGEVTADELTHADLAELFSSIGIDLPVTPTEEIIDFIVATDFDGIVFDASGKGNLNLYIKDVATVTSVKKLSTYAYCNGVPAVTLQVYGINGADTTAISEAVKKVIEEQSGNIECELVLLDDQASLINDSISNVLTSMLIGGAIAVVVIFLFLRKVKLSLIIAITMPLSVLCSLGCMYLMGITLNMVSLGGLAVGIGMLVDNGIVIIESITCERDKGKSAFEAAVDGTRLIAGSLIASTLTSVCVFFPILFTKGLTKMIFTDMSWSVILSITFSLLVAIIAVPTLYCAFCKKERLLTGRVFEGKPRSSENKAAESQKVPEIAQKQPKRKKLKLSVMPVYERFLRGCIRLRMVVIPVAIVIFAASAVLVFLTGTEFLPSVDQRTIEVKIAFSPTDEQQFCHDQTLSLYDELYATIPGIKSIAATVDGGSLLSKTTTGTIRIILKDSGSSTKSVLKAVRELTSERDLNATVSEVDGVLASLMSGMGGISDIGITVTGSDVDTLKEIAEKVNKTATERHGYFTDVTDDLSGITQEYLINIDKMKCLEKGIDYTVAVATLRAGLSGYTACTAELGESAVKVNVQFKSGTVGNYYETLTDYVLSLSTPPVTLGDVATVTPTATRAVIRRENGKHAMTLSAHVYGVDDGTAGDEFASIVDEVLSSYEGYSAADSGVNNYLGEVFRGLIIALAISFVLLFAVMACQFESIKKPFIIIFAIPFSFTGGFLALAISGLTLNVVSFVGLIMLMGVVVNNAIVMVERISQMNADGLSPYEAVIEGSKSRMRAIWMTTLTSVLALIPMALGIGSGAELMQPLGATVIGGLTLSTLVTLVLIPVIYSVICRVPKTDNGDAPVKNRRKREKKAANCNNAAATVTAVPPSITENAGALAPALEGADQLEQAPQAPSEQCPPCEQAFTHQAELPPAEQGDEKLPLTENPPFGEQSSEAQE